MTDFWGKAGEEITGRPEDAFTPEFDEIIPDGTTAPAELVLVELIDRLNQYKSEPEKFYQITWSIVSGEFKGRQVTQKIKCFFGKPAQIAKALNMLMLIMKLCNYKPPHSNEPTAAELMSMRGKILGIKICEYQLDVGDKILTGNWVREAHAVTDAFITQTGVKLKPKVAEQKHPAPDFGNPPPIGENDIPW